MRNLLPQAVVLIAAILLASAATSVPGDVEYAVIKRQAIPGIKLSLDVRLNKKVPAEVLQSIAQQLKDSESGRYERIFILYYLPGMRPGSGAWASSHFNPELSVRILGLSAQEEAALGRPESSPGPEILGAWLDEVPYAASRITIYRESGRTYLEQKYKTGGSSKKQVVSTDTNRGKRYQEKGGNSFGEYYLLDNRGDLQLWDAEGLIRTAKKLKR